MTRRLQANGPLGAGVLDGLAGRHAGTNALLDPGRLAGETGRTALHKLIRGVVANRAVFSQFSLSESQLWCAPTIPAGPACGQRCVCVCLYLWGRVASDRPVTPVVRDRSRGTIWHTPKRIVHGLALSFGALEVEDIGARFGTNIHSMTIREVFIEVPDDFQ